jgi:hypothetical protein
MRSEIVGSIGERPSVNKAVQSFLQVGFLIVSAHLKYIPRYQATFWYLYRVILNKCDSFS